MEFVCCQGVTATPAEGAKTGPKLCLWPPPMTTRARELVQAMGHNAQPFLEVEERVHTSWFQGMPPGEKLMAGVACPGNAALRAMLPRDNPVAEVYVRLFSAQGDKNLWDTWKKSEVPPVQSVDHKLAQSHLDEVLLCDAESSLQNTDMKGGFRRTIRIASVTCLMRTRWTERRMHSPRLVR